MIFTATLYNLWLIPHPMWVAAGGLLRIVGLTLLASRPPVAAATGGSSP